MDFPSINVRLLGFSSDPDFPYGFTGFLHRGGNYRTVAATPRHAGRNRQEYRASAPGDAFIVYLDREHFAVRSSIRHEATRARALKTARCFRRSSGAILPLPSRLPPARFRPSPITSAIATFRKIEQRLLRSLIAQVGPCCIREQGRHPNPPSTSKRPAALRVLPRSDCQDSGPSWLVDLGSSGGFKWVTLSRVNHADSSPVS